MRDKNTAFNIGIFAIVMAVTFGSVFRGQNVGKIVEYIKKMSFTSVAGTAMLAILFVVGEGSMIWYLLTELKQKTTFLHCVGYSFVGFFFSGLTPSATGGQPVQAYYMKKDGIVLSASSVVLMTVAVIYKFVLVLIGIGIYLLWRKPLENYLQGYYWLYFLGLFLNISLVILLLMIMFCPRIIKIILSKAERILIWMKILKFSENRNDNIERFLMSYHETVQFLKSHKRIIGMTVIGTFFQRSCMFILTYIVYEGLGLKGVTAGVIVLLQAAISVAVDMLPLPGAQGITETMYKTVFRNIFPGQYMVASICITRGFGFYFIMLLSFLIWGTMDLQGKGYVKKRRNE